MSISIKYEKGVYQAKIAELEGYYSQLETHLVRMEELKNQMFSFWDDENAQLTGLVLAEEIRYVKDTMDTTMANMTFYKSAIEKLEGANVSVKDVLEEALSLFKLLG